MAAIRKACGKDVEFVFMDAPKVLGADDLEGFGDLASLATEAGPDGALRGWWSSDVARTRFRHEDLNLSLTAFRDALAKDRFDGVFGFSQGGVMAAMLAGLLERPELHPPFLIEGKAPHPPLKFCVVVAGFLPPNERWARFLTPSYTTPTLHVMGLTDPIVSQEQAHTLVAVNKSEYSRVAPHEGGHFVPSKAPWRNFLKAYFKDPYGDAQPPPPVVETKGEEAST
ncbi:FSH3_2 [Sanghuangporus sanghuang]